LQCGDPTDPAHTGAATATSGCGATPIISYTDVPLPGDCTQNGLERAWIASACGIQSLVCVQHIRFIDTQPPTFQTVPPLDDFVPCGMPVPAPPPIEVFQVTDNCDPNPTLTFSETRSAPLPDGSYTITRIWSATDLCGNRATQGELIFVAGCIGTADLTGISGVRFYDANGNGQQDSSEPGLPGWPMLLSGGNGSISLKTFTDPTGHYSFSGLPSGVYSISPQRPLQLNWQDTTPSTLVAVSSGPATSYDFGTVSVGPGGSQGIGFWTTKNGLRALQTRGVDTELAMLRRLNLRNSDGTAFDPSSYDQLKAWLQGARSANLAYMLSAQVASAALSVDTGLADDSALVQAAGLRCVTPEGGARLAGVLAESNAELGLHPLTTSGSAFRSYQNLLQNALAAANNNQSFLQATPGPATFGQ
jgi:hypothetical protein